VIGEGKQAVVVGVRAAVRLRTVRGSDAAGGRLAEAMVLSSRADNKRAAERDALEVNE
jgi:hypothetical protein